MDLITLQQELNTRDDGLLRHGSHQEGREFCALEFESQVRGRAWSDKPVTLPDLRRLNDARWSSDRARTEALLPVMVALWNWAEWTAAQRTAWAQHVAIATVQQIVSGLPRLSEAIREQCKAAKTCGEARAAADASAAYASASAAYASAAYASAAAADASAAYAYASAADASAAYAYASAASAAAYAYASAASAAAAAAEAAYAYASASAAYAYASAASAAAAADAADAVLRTACSIWITAAHTIERTIA